MLPRTTLLSAVTLTALLFATAAFPQSPEKTSGRRSLAERIGTILERPEFAGSTFGIFITELKNGEVVYSHNPDTLLAPASTTKLVSCAGALEALGADYRFETPLVRSGPLEDGIVEGDLVLVASGDPNLSQRIGKDNRLRFTDKDHTYAGFLEAELVPGDPLMVLRRLVEQAVANGVREVKGDLIVDDGLFRETKDSFVGEFSAVCVNDNVVDITVSPASEAGKPASVDYQPRLPVVKVECRAKTASPGSGTRLWVESGNGVASFVVDGTIASDAQPTLRVGVLRNPALAAAHYLADLFAAAGVTVHGKKRRERFGPNIYRSYPVVARHVSPPFSETIRVILKVSHNLHATMLPVLVGALKGGRGERTAGYAHMRRTLARAGMEVQSVVLQSGSGGAHADRLSPRFLVDLLRHMAGQRDFRAFYDALPVGGVDGTLAEHCRTPELRGRVRAKTGTLIYRGSFNDRWIYLSKALAGYLDLSTEKRPDDNKLAFAIIIANTVAHSRQEGANQLFHAQEEILRAAMEERGRGSDG